MTEIMQNPSQICPQCQEILSEQMQFCPCCGYNLMIHKNAAKKQEELSKKMAEIDDAIAKEKMANQFQKFLHSPVVCYSGELKENFKLANLFRRSIAYLFDSILLYSISFFLLFQFVIPPAWPWEVNILEFSEEEMVNYHLNWDVFLTILILLKFFLTVGYFVFFESRPAAQSIGKMLMRIQLYDINRETVPTRQQVIVHALGKAFEFGLLLEILIPRQTPTFPLLNQENSPIIRNMIRMSQRMTNIIIIQKSN